MTADPMADHLRWARRREDTAETRATHGDRCPRCRCAWHGLACDSQFCACPSSIREDQR